MEDLYKLKERALERTRDCLVVMAMFNRCMNRLLFVRHYRMRQKRRCDQLLHAHAHTLNTSLLRTYNQRESDGRGGDKEKKRMHDKRSISAYNIGKRKRE